MQKEKTTTRYGYVCRILQPGLRVELCWCRNLHTSLVWDIRMNLCVQFNQHHTRLHLSYTLPAIQIRFSWQFFWGLVTLWRHLCRPHTYTIDWLFHVRCMRFDASLLMESFELLVLVLPVASSCSTGAHYSDRLFFYILAVNVMANDIACIIKFKWKLIIAIWLPYQRYNKYCRWNEWHVLACQF